MSEPIVTNLAKIWEDEYGIMHIQFFPRAEFTDADAQEYTKSCIEISKGKPKLVIVDLSNISYLQMNAVKKLMGPELTALTKASAIIVDTKSNFVVGAVTFVMNIDKQPYPFKVCTDEIEAVKWLLEQKK